MCPVILPLHFLSTLGLWHLVQDEQPEQSINPLTRSLVLPLHVHSAIFHHSNQVRSQPLCVSSLTLTPRSRLWLLFPSVAPPSPAILTPLLTLNTPNLPPSQGLRTSWHPWQKLLNPRSVLHNPLLGGLSSKSSFNIFYSIFFPHHYL